MAGQMSVVPSVLVPRVRNLTRWRQRAYWKAAVVTMNTKRKVTFLGTPIAITTATIAFPTLTAAAAATPTAAPMYGAAAWTAAVVTAETASLAASLRTGGVLLGRILPNASAAKAPTKGAASEIAPVASLPTVL